MKTVQLTLPDKEFFKLMKTFMSNGKYFTCTFIKQDGELRKLMGRCGVWKFTNGVGLNYKPSDYHNIIVWEVRKQQYRTIKTDELLTFKQGSIQLYKQIPEPTEHLKELVNVEEEYEHHQWG